MGSARQWNGPVPDGPDRAGSCVGNPSSTPDRRSGGEDGKRPTIITGARKRELSSSI